MERQDGRDPFDPQTYFSENGFNITTMIQLRAFCASFFERHIRHNRTSTNEELIARFLQLITYSDFFFLRARTVIPELQVPGTVTFHENVNTRRTLLKTQKFRGPPGKKWSIPTEELAWAKLSSDGRAMLEKQANGHTEQSNDASGQLSISKFVKTKPKLSFIPTFVPQSVSGSEQLVWSPIHGTRLRRSDEKYQTPATSPAPLMPRHQPTFECETPTKNVDALSEHIVNLCTGKFPHNSIPLLPTPRTPSTQSPSGTVNSGSASQRMQGSSMGLIPGYRTPVSFQGPAKNVHEHQRQGSRPPPIHTNSHMNGPRCPVNRTRGVPGIEPFLAPAHVPRFRGRHDSGQGRYRRRFTHFQPPRNSQFYSPAINSNNLVPSHEIWGFPPPAQPQGQNMTFHNQMVPLPSQMDDFMVIPTQGSMGSIEYWDLLYQLEADFLVHLCMAGEPMAEAHQLYIAQLEQARMTAIRARLPHRGKMDKKDWLQELERELHGIWERKPGQMEDTPVKLARKRDYERLVSQEIEKAQREG